MILISQPLLIACSFSNCFFRSRACLWPRISCLLMAYNVPEHVRRLFSKEPEGTWHPLCEVHAGGPAWRWPKAGCLSKPYPSRINNQRYNLDEPDLLPNFFSYLKDLKIKVSYKQRLDKFRISLQDFFSAGSSHYKMISNPWTPNRVLPYRV
jgi:hypothetical protein